MRSIQSKDVLGGADYQDPNVFVADRRWILGDRKNPVGNLERVMKIPKKATHYVQSGIYSLAVTEGKHLVHTYVSSTETKTKTHDFPLKVEYISPAPPDGWYVVSLINGDMVLVDNAGAIRPFPRTDYAVFPTSFHWINAGKELLLLAGSQFGHVYCFYISRSSIRMKTIYADQNNKRTPITSITEFTHEGKRYVIVSNYLYLYALAWDNFEEEARLHSVVERVGQVSNACSTFVAANKEKIAWMTNEEVRIFTGDQLIKEAVGAYSTPFSSFQNALNVSQPRLLMQQLSVPITMTKYYIIISSQTSIIGLDTDTLDIAFHFPFIDDEEHIIKNINYNQKTNSLQILTTTELYKIDFTSEKQYEPLPIFSEVKQEAINYLEPSKKIPAMEILSSLLESDSYKKAISILTKHLNSLKIPKAIGEMDEIPSEMVEQLCVQFLIYELEVISACASDEAPSFAPVHNLNFGPHFDTLNALSQLLRIRAFSRVADFLRDPSFVSAQEATETGAQLLLDDGDIKAAVDVALRLPEDERLFRELVLRARDLGPLYDRIDEPGVAQRVFDILPLLAGQLPSPICFKLMSAAAELKSPVDLLVWSVALCPEGAANDEALFKVLHSTIKPVRVVDPFEAFQHLLAHEFFHSAAEVAAGAQMHLEAIRAVSLITGEGRKHERERYIRQYIRRAPRNQWQRLCEQYGIVQIDDDEEALDGPSKEALAKKLEEMRARIKELTNEAKQSAEFLENLDEWGGNGEPPQDKCRYCHRPIAGIPSVSFPCGHVFHERCLRPAAWDTLSAEQKDELMQKGGRASKEDSARLQDLFYGDCPACGLVSVNLVRVPVTGAASKWARLQ